MGLFSTKIKNNEKAIRARLDYLRYKDVNDVAVGHSTRDVKITERPRTIEYEYRGYMLCVIRHPYDTKHYHYTDHALKTIAGWNSALKSDGVTPWSFLDKVMTAYTIRRGEFPNTVDEEKPNQIIPYQLFEVNDFGGCCLPDSLRVLGCDEKKWKDAWETAFDLYYWDGAGYLNIPQAERWITKNEGTEYEERYIFRLEPVIRVYINGIDCRKHNLTYTEQAKIIEAIKDRHELSGSFISDGKELREYINAYKLRCCENEVGKRINSRELYGERK